MKDRIKAITISFVLFKSLAAHGQIDCSVAASQLQNYAQQVNHQYQFEYLQNIPNFRCPTVNSFGQPVYPAVVQNCRNQMLIGLNYWYGQQCNMINNWFMQIARTCTTQPNRSKPAPSTGQGDPKQIEDINVQDIQKLDSDMAQSETETRDVLISIPKTPNGYKPR